MHISIPKHASDIIKTLSAHGYEAYVVGGCVRILFLEKSLRIGILLLLHCRSRLKHYFQEQLIQD